MLMTIINASVAVISIGLAIFIFYPPPPPSPFVFQLQDSGKYHVYKGHQVFHTTYQSDVNQDTLLILHGFPTSSYDFYKVIPDLRKKFRLIVLVDFLGFGFSDKPADFEYSINSQANIIDSLVKSMNIKKIHLMSHDYGDTVAQELLARQIIDKNQRSYRIDSLCMLNGGIFPETNKPLMIQKVLSFPVIGGLLARLMNYRTFSLRMDDLFGEDTKASEQEMRDMWHLLHKNKGYALAPQLLSYISERIKNRDRWVGALQNTKVPVLMIYGPADPVNPPPFQDHFRKTLPNAQIAVLDDRIGHYPQLEAPNELVTIYNSFYDKYKTPS